MFGDPENRNSLASNTALKDTKLSHATVGATDVPFESRGRATMQGVDNSATELSAHKAFQMSNATSGTLGPQHTQSFTAPTQQAGTATMAEQGKQNGNDVSVEKVGGKEAGEPIRANPVGMKSAGKRKKSVLAENQMEWVDTPANTDRTASDLVTAQVQHSESLETKILVEKKSSDSPEMERMKKEWKYDPKIIVMESTEWVESEQVQLDKYHSDINMIIRADGFSCFPLSKFGFGYMWAGARANYGVSFPCSVLFQMKVIGEIAVNIKGDPFGSNHMARVGWSIAGPDYQLGEAPYSFGYQSNGRCCCDSQFVDYGESYGVGDIITAYLTITEEMVTVAFSKNGETAKQAYQLESHLLGLNSLYPHVASKNMALAVNFGFRKRPWVPIDREYTWISRVPLEERDRATKPPAKKSDCELLLMVGMVGAGKSHWIANKLDAEPEKNWNVISMPELLKKMKVEGVETAQCYNGRWDDLFDKTNTCLKKLLPIAASKLRNYILDQTNVYEGAQSRKVRPFRGFKRKAVVVLPSDEVYQQRLEERKKTANKCVHEDAILEMKANFHIPITGEKEGLEYSFDEVIYTEKSEADAAELVAKYNAEGQKKFRRISKQYHKRDAKAKLRIEDLAKKKQHAAERANGQRGRAFFAKGRGKGNRNEKSSDSTQTTLCTSDVSTRTDEAVGQAALQVPAEAQLDVLWPGSTGRGIRSLPPRGWGGMIPQPVRGGPRMFGPQGQPHGEIQRSYGPRGVQMGNPRAMQMGVQRGVAIRANQMRMEGNQPRFPGSHVGMEGNQPRMPGSQVGMEGHQPRMPGSQVGMEGNQPRLPGNQPRLQGNQMRMPNNQLGMQANHIPMQRNRMPIHVNQAGLQGNQVGMQGNQVRLQGNQVRLQGNQVRMQGNQVPMRGNQVPMQGNQVHMQGAQVPMLGNQARMQGNQVRMQGNRVGWQGNQMGAQRSPMAMSGDQMGISRPRIPIQNQMPIQVNQMPIQPAHMPIQGNQMPIQGSQMPKQGNQMRTEVNHIALTGNQMSEPSGAASVPNTQEMREVKEGTHETQVPMQVDQTSGSSQMQHMWSEMQQTMTQTMAENMQNSMLQAFQQQMETAGRAENWHYDAAEAKWQAVASQDATWNPEGTPYVQGQVGYDDSHPQQQYATQQEMEGYEQGYGGYG